MIDLISKLKRMIVEPRVYALMVTSTRGQVLHLGVHFSLEEAYTAARKRLEELVPHKPGENVNIDLWNTLPARLVLAQFVDPTYIGEIVDIPENTPKQAPDAVVAENPTIEDLQKIPNPIADMGIHPFIQSLLNGEFEFIDNTDYTNELSLTDHIEDFRESKNHLMKKLISEGNVKEVEKLKDLLGTNAKRYVLNAIAKKKTNQHPSSEDSSKDKNI